MKTHLALLVLAAVVARAAAQVEYRHLSVFGAPLVGVRYGDQPADGLHTQEALGWRSLFDAPFILAVQEDPSRPELSAYLVKNGMRSLPKTADRRFLHSYLMAGPEKVGLLLSGSNFVSLPQVDMPITRFSLPTGFSLAESARLHADYYSFPTLLVVNRDDMSGREISRLALVGDFTLFPDAIRVSNDVPSPAAAWGRRNTAAFTSVNGMNSAPRVPHFAPEPVSLAVNPFSPNANGRLDAKLG